MERPLRLNFHASPERMERLAREKTLIKLGDDQKEELLDALLELPDTAIRNRANFEKALATALNSAGVKIGAPVKKAILSALSERDDSAAICTDSHGKPEPDPELRDYELVPLKEDWRTYVARARVHRTPFIDPNLVRSIPST